MALPMLRVPLAVGGSDPQLAGNASQEQMPEELKKIMLRVSNGDPGKGGRIPQPNYKDSASRLNYIKQFGNKYGDFVRGRGDAIVRVNESPAWGSKSAKELASNYGKQLGIDPALFYSSAMEEGMSGLFPDQNNMVKSSNNKDYPVSGFGSFGLDNVYDRYPEFIKKGYLPADFQKNIVKRVHQNEKGENVNSADFKSVDAALQAKAAYIRSNYDDIDAYAKSKGVKLSPQQRDFFALANYNSGAGNAQKMLEAYKQKGYLKNDEFIKKRPDESWKQVYDNVSVRLKMRDALKNEGLFDDEQDADKQKLLLKTAQNK